MGIISRALHDTFDGRAVQTFFLIMTGAAASFLTLYLIQGREEAVLEVPSIVAGLIGASLPLLILFLWNLACAPVRLERERGNRLQAEIDSLGGRRVADWKPWRNREFFTVREAAFILAGEEPRSGEISGPVLAFYSEIVWAMQEYRIIKVMSDRARQFLRMREAMADTPVMEVAETDRMPASSFRNFLAQRTDPASYNALINLGEPELARLTLSEQSEHLSETGRTGP